jgi:hypothetical protein
MVESDSGHAGHDGHDDSQHPPTAPARTRASREVRRARREQLLRTPLLDRFGLVLVLVLFTIAVQALIDVRGSIVAQLFAHAISGLALVAAVRASGARRRWRRAADLLVAGVVLLSLGLLLWRSPNGSTAVPPETTWLLAAALTPVLIARRVLQHTVVTIQTIMGSVAAYLQLAVAFAFLFQTLDAYSASHFFGEEVSTTTYMYFSLVTISTVGFGDVAAVTDLGRLAASSEAVVGQVYLVTFVALIVARFAAGMPRASAAAGAGGPGSAPPPGTLFEALDSSRTLQPLPGSDDEDDDHDDDRYDDDRYDDDDGDESGRARTP